MNFEVALKIQKCAMGDEVELSIGEIAGESIEPEKIVRGMSEDKKARALEIIESYLNDTTTKVYTGEEVMDEMDRIRSEIEQKLTSDERLPLFRKMYAGVEGLFMSPPFEGLDQLASGIVEVCVFAALEYYGWKKTGFDHEYYRLEFRDNLARRAGDKVTAYWMNVYDDIQKILTEDLDESMKNVILAIEAQEPGKSEMTEKDLEVNVSRLRAFIEGQLSQIK